MSCADLEAKTPFDIAHQFEKRCLKSGLKGLNAILDGFAAAVGPLEVEHTGPCLFAFTEDRIGPNVTTDQTSSSRRTVRVPHILELRKDGPSDSTICLLKLDFVDKLFQIGFQGNRPKPRPIEVRQIVFRMAPVDAATVASSATNAANDTVSTEQEIEHLTTSACAILEKVCASVKFDNITVIPDLLGEALLRIVRPLTARIKIEEVTLKSAIGGGPVTVSKTVTLNDLAAQTQGPRHEVIPTGHVELSPGSRMSVVHNSRYKVFT